MKIYNLSKRTNSRSEATAFLSATDGMDIETPERYLQKI